MGRLQDVSLFASKAHNSDLDAAVQELDDIGTQRCRKLKKDYSVAILERNAQQSGVFFITRSEVFIAMKMAILSPVNNG